MINKKLYKSPNIKNKKENKTKKEKKNKETFVNLLNLKKDISKFYKNYINNKKK
jgi:hypothetical protein